MLMREVKYVRWKAWRDVALSGLLTLGGLALAWVLASGWLGLLVAFVGAVLMHISRLPLLEKDVLLRLTPTGVWTKELGWQRWEQVRAYLENGSRSGPPNILIIHRLHEVTPRFFEYIGALDVDRKEVQYWLDRHARPA